MNTVNTSQSSCLDFTFTLISRSPSLLLPLFLLLLLVFPCVSLRSLILLNVVAVVALVVVVVVNAAVAAVVAVAAAVVVNFVFPYFCECFMSLFFSFFVYLFVSRYSSWTAGLQHSIFSLALGRLEDNVCL